MTLIAFPRLAAWPVLEQALRTRRPVALRYHGQDRVACPHALGFKAAVPGSCPTRSREPPVPVR